MTACGGDGSSESTIVATVPETAPSTTSSTVRATSSTRPAPASTRPTTPRTTASPTTARPTVAPPPSTTATTVPQARTVTLGETFVIGVGEAVTVSGEGLTITFTAVISDNRCPPAVQCIVAGNATIVVAASKAGMSGSLTLGTDMSESATYGRYKVELVLLGRGSSPSARLRVT